MRIHKLSTLLAGAFLCGLAPTSLAGEDYGKSLDEDQKKEIVKAFELALQRELPAMDGPCESKACQESCTEECKAYTAKYVAKMEANPTAYYGEMFAKKPVAWQVLSPMIEKRFGAYATTADQRGIMLDLVAYAPYETSAELSTALWDEDRQAFTEEHVLAFASRGGKCFHEELRARVASNTCGDIRPAALLAFYGDDTGKEALVHAVKQANYGKDACQPLVAALALEKLGHEGSFDRTRQRVSDAALEALDEGDLGRARQLALQAQFFTELAGLTEGKGKWAKLDLAWLNEKVSNHCQSRSDELASAEAVFELIESVTPM